MTEIQTLKARAKEALDVAAKETSRLSTELNFFGHKQRAEKATIIEDEIYELYSRINDL